MSRLLPTLAILALSLSPLSAQEPGDKSAGEELQIKARVRWFSEQRGLFDNADAGRLRAEAALQTQARILEQGRNRTLTNLWSSVGPSPMNVFNWAFGTVSGRVTTISVDPTNPNTLYVGGAAGGFWKSTNGGTSWTNLFETQPTQSIGASAVAAYDPDVIWVGTGDYNSGCSGYYGMGVFQSTDGGQTFQARNGSGTSVMDLSHISSVSLHPTNAAVVVVGGTGRCVAGSGGTGAIFHTSDGGLTWSEVYSEDTHEIVRDPSNPNVLYAAVRGDGVVKSTNGGQTWTPANSGLVVGTSRIEIAISPSNPQTLYCLSSNSRLYRTLNGGGSWALRSSNACDGQCSYNMTLMVASNNSDTLYRGTILPYKSTNGGSTSSALTAGWSSAQTVHQDIQHLEPHPTDPNTFFIGSDGGIWKSTDGGSSFTNLNGNLNMTQFYDIGIHPTDDTIVVGGSQDNSSEAYTGSPVWDTTRMTGDGFVSLINPVDTNYAYTASYYGAIYRSTNGATGNYNRITTGFGGTCDWLTPFVLDPANPSIMYVACERIHKSTDRGSSFSPISPTLAGGSQDAFAVAPSDSNVMYSAGSTRFNRTFDGGANWEEARTGLPVRAITDIAVDAADPMKVSITVSGFNVEHVWYTTDGGDNWLPGGNGLPNAPANAVLLLTNPDRVYVGTDVGVFVSSTGSRGAYVPDMNGFPQGVPVTELEYNPNTNTITAGTYGRGAWQKDATSITKDNVLVGKGPADQAGYDSRINAYRDDGSRITAVDFTSFSNPSFGANVAGGDVVGDGLADIFSGPGPGSTLGPMGALFDLSGTAIAGGLFSAYGGTGYGLNVSLGDLEADDRDELVTGPGEGPVYGPQVRAFNHDGSGTVTPLSKVNYFAYGTLRYGANVADPSWDGDAIYSEILTGAGPGAVFGPHVRGWHYDATSIRTDPKVNFFSFSTLKFGVNVTGGDVDVDGFDELIAGAGPGAVFGAAVRGFNVDGGATSAMSKINYFAYAVGKFGTNVASGDVDGDNYGEIVTGPGPDPNQPANLRAWNYDATSISDITALNLDAWTGLSYGLTVGTGMMGY